MFYKDGGRASKSLPVVPSTHVLTAVTCEKPGEKLGEKPGEAGFLKILFLAQPSENMSVVDTEYAELPISKACLTQWWSLREHGSGEWLAMYEARDFGRFTGQKETTTHVRGAFHQYQSQRKKNGYDSCPSERSAGDKDNCRVLREAEVNTCVMGITELTGTAQNRRSAFLSDKVKTNRT
ncbi:hypothetical protein K435DRAFT_803613 [Dendrothele bispora CBS 962.96]|uniref:Uncharacterized protein n=1 Tax=Dendrothele bispora (strain CBS 962.96) TaxID=1314807 RepID=A0A4S8LHM4_DENBC|nr:hypothetical protein K435DRAFT_803613 [Dendrothele bispora CBS 962.96]